MTARKTLFVVGAGASAEAYLPTGRQLTDLISSLLNFEFAHFEQTKGDRVIGGALRILSAEPGGLTGNINPFLDAASRIRDAMPQAMSIDNFIDQHSGENNIEVCGKLAIVRSILQAEQNSLLYFNENKANAKPDYGELRKTWYNSLWQLLTENCRKEDLAERFKAASFIIFNYDRCIEHFLCCSIINYYRTTPTEAAELVNQIDIFHPFGVVGHLPWQPEHGSIRFGADPAPNELIEIAKQIKTFTEGTDPGSSEIISIRQTLFESKIVVFLGFAFHKLNMKLLAPDENARGRSPRTKCYATARGISNSDCGLISKELKKLGTKEIATVNLRNELSCVKLFEEYNRNLAFAQ